LRSSPPGKNTLIHLWSEERNLTRRLLSVKKRDHDCMVLEVQRFGKARPGRLEFLRRDNSRSPGRVTREQFRARFARILAEKFPDSTVDSLTSSPDLEHSFSGLYVRATMHEGSHGWALLAAGPSEADSVEDMLACGILWLEWCRDHSEKRGIEGLRLVVPEGTSRPLRERSPGLSSAAKIEIFEMRGPDSLMERFDPADAGNLESYLGARSEAEMAIAGARDAIERIRAMLPENPSVITLRVPAGTRDVAFCHGIEFARRTRDGIGFGLGKSFEKLKASNESRLRKLLQDLDLHRSPLASDTNHRLFRGAPERWLESVILADPTRLDAVLDPKHFYSQVPALAAGDRKIFGCRYKLWIIGCVCGVISATKIFNASDIFREWRSTPGRPLSGWSLRHFDFILRPKFCKDICRLSFRSHASA
jgi:hypothetical protein